MPPDIRIHEQAVEDVSNSTNLDGDLSNLTSREALVEAPNTLHESGKFRDEAERKRSRNRGSAASRASVISSEKIIMGGIRASDTQENNEVHPNSDSTEKKSGLRSLKFLPGQASPEQFPLRDVDENVHSAVQQVDEFSSNDAVWATAAGSNPGLGEPGSLGAISKETFVDPVRPLPGSPFMEEYFNRILVEVDLETPPKEEISNSFDPEIDIPGWGECMYSELATSAHAAAYFGHYQVNIFIRNLIYLIS